MTLVDDPRPDSTAGLRSWTSCGGCGAKWPASELRDLLRALPGSGGPDVHVGLAPFDDAAVHAVGPDLSLVSTTDFFPPLVDDPADFGAIAAANACSDIFAMGARVLLALNIAAFPESFPLEHVTAILTAANEVVVEAGGYTGGGHTIRNPEPVFGLAVQGLVENGRHFTKGGARPGDVVVLSKPLGTGLVLAGGDAGAIAAVTVGMRALNRRASEALVARHDQVHAVTDVTGFGLLGHGMEMAERSEVTMVLDSSTLPLYDGAVEAAEAGVRTGADRRNRDYTAGRVQVTAGATWEALGYDAQTSGGLLAAVTPQAAADLSRSGFVPIGEIAEFDGVNVRLR